MRMIGEEGLLEIGKERVFFKDEFYLPGSDEFWEQYCRVVFELQAEEPVMVFYTRSQVKRTMYSLFDSTNNVMPRSPSVERSKSPG